MAISVEQGRLILPGGERLDRWSERVPDPAKSVSLLAVLVIHAVALGGLLAVQVAPRMPIAETVIEATIVADEAPPDDAPTLPRVPDWRPVLPEVPLPRVTLEETSTAITLPPPDVVPAVAAMPPSVIESSAPPVLDAQAVGYLVPPAPRYPPASRRAREEGEVLILADNQGKEVRVPVAEIDEQAVTPLSPMPANVPDIVPEADFYHLLAYLLAQRQATPAPE